LIWRLVELAILGWIVATWLRRLVLPTPPASHSPSTGPFGAPDPSPPTAMTLVRCATCGTHVPVGRAVAIGTDGRAFCSEACRPPRPS